MTLGTATCLYSRIVKLEGLSFAILTALAAGPQHGYGILRDVQDLGDGQAAPPVGSLYRVLDRLRADGLIAEAGADVVDGRFRRYYQLTDDGVTSLSTAADARARTARAAKERLRRHRAANDLATAPSARA